MTGLQRPTVAGTMCLLFAGFNVKYLTEPQFREVIAQDNALRKERKLPQKPAPPQ